MHDLDGFARCGTELAIDLAHIEALLLEQRLQLFGLFVAEGVDRLAIAAAEVWRTSHTHCEVRGGRRIRQRLVPRRVDAEVLIGEQRRAIAAHRQQQRRLEPIGWEFARDTGDAPLGPLRARKFDCEIGLIPREVLRQSHFLEPRFARAPAQGFDEVRRRADDVGDIADEIAPAVLVVVKGVVEIVLR